MKLGMEAVIVSDKVAVYAKLTSKALYALTCRGLLNNFNDHMSTINQRMGSIYHINCGNKFLRRHGLDELVALTPEEIAAIQRGESPPAGSLLCSLS